MTLALRHSQFGNRWSAISKYLPGRTDNDLKNLWHSTLRAKSCRRSSLLFNYVQLVRECPDEPAARRAAYDKAMHMTYGGGGAGVPSPTPSPRHASGAQSPQAFAQLQLQLPQQLAGTGPGGWEVAGFGGPVAPPPLCASPLQGPNSGGSLGDAVFGVQSRAHRQGPSVAAASAGDGAAVTFHEGNGTAAGNGGAPLWRLRDPNYGATAGDGGGADDDFTGRAGGQLWRPAAFPDALGLPPQLSLPRPVSAGGMVSPPAFEWQGGRLMQPHPSGRPTSQPQPVMPQHLLQHQQVALAGAAQERQPSEQNQHQQRQQQQQPQGVQNTARLEKLQQGPQWPASGLGLQPTGRAVSAPVGIPFVAAPPPPSELQLRQQQASKPLQEGRSAYPQEQWRQQPPQQQQQQPGAMALGEMPSDGSPFRFPQPAIGSGGGAAAPAGVKQEGWDGQVPGPGHEAVWRRQQQLQQLQLQPAMPGQQGASVGRIGGFFGHNGADGGGSSGGDAGGSGGGAGNSGSLRRPPMRQSTAPNFAPAPPPLWMQPQPQAQQQWAQQAQQQLHPVQPQQQQQQQVPMRPRPLSAPVAAVAAALNGDVPMEQATECAADGCASGPLLPFGWQRHQEQEQLLHQQHSQQPQQQQRQPFHLAPQPQQLGMGSHSDRLDVTLGDMWLPAGGGSAGAARDGDAGASAPRGSGDGGPPASLPTGAAPGMQAAAPPAQLQQPKPSMLAASHSEPAGCVDTDQTLAAGAQWRAGAAPHAVQQQAARPSTLLSQQQQQHRVLPVPIGQQDGRPAHATLDPLDELMDELDRAQASGGLLLDVRQVARSGSRHAGIFRPIGPMGLSHDAGAAGRPMGGSEQQQQSAQHRAAPRWAGAGARGGLDGDGVVAAAPSFSIDWMAPGLLAAAPPPAVGSRDGLAARASYSRGVAGASASTASVCTDAAVTLGLGDEDLGLFLGSLGALGE